MTPIEILETTASRLGSWAELQRRLRVSRQTIWLWKTGRSQPRGDVIAWCVNFLRSEK